MKHGICLLLVAALGLLDGQVIVSRRVYTRQGRSWRQLWLADRGTTNFRQLTHSRMDHMEPVCSRDGRLIYFVSDRDGARSRNAYAGADDRQVWAFDRQTAQERLVWQTSDDGGVHLRGTSADGGVLVRVGSELRSLSPHPWVLANVDPAYNAVAVSPDGRRLAAVIAGSFDKEGQSRDARLFVVDTASGASRVELGKFEAPTWSPDGKRIAAMASNGLAILDVASTKEISRAGWPRPEPIPEDLSWSPDARYVLAGLYSDNGGAGDPQQDYFLLDVATQAWTTAFTARRVLWLPGSRSLLNLRPVETSPLAPGSPHQVWTAQLAVFDLSTRRNADLTSGVVLNDDLASCGY
jgi:Tol biopolymer transport system component